MAALLRYKIGVIFTPAGAPGTHPVKVKTVVSSVFPRSQEPVDRAECYSEARQIQQAVANAMDRLNENTGALPAHGTFCEPVFDTDQ